MTDDAHRGPGDMPGVDTLALLAAGFFPTHAPRSTGAAYTAATQAAVDRCCDATAEASLLAEQAQTPIETEPARTGAT